MSLRDPRFASWAQDLAPGLAHPEWVVRDRILYRSASPSGKSSSDLPGNEMEVALGSLEAGASPGRLATLPGLPDPGRDRFPDLRLPLDEGLEAEDLMPMEVGP